MANAKRGLIFALYSPGRELHQKELEASLTKDLVNFDFITFSPADSIANIAREVTKGYDYAIEHGYEFVARIDDDDLLVPGALTQLMEVLDQNTTLSGACGKQISFTGTAPKYTLRAAPEVTYNISWANFHGVTLYRPKALYPVLNTWKEVPHSIHHMVLVKMMIRNGHYLGHIDTPSTLYRRKVRNGIAYSPYL